MTDILLAGCGNMGYAMLSGWLDSGRLEAGLVGVVEPDPRLRERAAARGVTTFEEVGQVGAQVRPRLVVLAVKPQILGELLPGYRRFARAGSAFLSIAAGTRIARIEQQLGANVPVIRCMPNTPAAIGEAMTVMVGNAHAGAVLLDEAERLLGAIGKVARVEDENLMDAVTALSGSGPAYLFHFIECLTHAGEQAGLPRELAATLALQTVLGSARLAASSPLSPAELRRQVTSPNGTTAAALAVLMGEDRLQRLVSEAVEAAKRRSLELG